MPLHVSLGFSVSSMPVVRQPWAEAISVPTTQQGRRGSGPCPQSPHILSGSGGGTATADKSVPPAHLLLFFV